MVHCASGRAMKKLVGKAEGRARSGRSVTKSLISLTVMRFFLLKKLECVKCYAVENGKVAATDIKEIARHQIFNQGARVVVVVARKMLSYLITLPQSHENLHIKMPP